MGQRRSPLTEFNWRRELLLVSMAGMEASWLAGWTLILLGAGQTAGLVTVWFSTFVLYLLAVTTARTLIRRRSRHSDWIIGGLVLLSALSFVNLNLYPEIGLFNPRWLGTLVGNITSGAQSWPHELTALFIGFFIWFRGLRLPRRFVGLRTMALHVQIGVAMVTGLAIIATEFPVNVGGVVVTYFAAALLSLALARIEETARTEGGAASPFGRKWLMTLAAALLVVALIALIGRSLFTVDVIRMLLRPVAILIAAILSAFALLFGLVAQYLILPLLLRMFEGRIPEELLNLQLSEQQFQPAGEGRQWIIIDPAILNALRVAGLFLLALVVLWLVIRSFRRWRVRRGTAGGTRETVRPAGNLADDLMDYLRDQWQRLRQLADVRRLLQLRGAGSVRAMYANLLTLMAAADHPRPAGQTPYEYEPTIEQALPDREAEVSAITDAYVRVRYGEEDISDAELRSLREAWRGVRTDGEKLLES